ncbi:MAG: DUF1573 domain-containing protein, partial [Candidatus Adiutrix sp.]|nr:DUF1573 domain-containing protein [Candidatus Adiutrix sp.]
MRAKRGRPSKAAVWLILIGLAWGAEPAVALGAEAGGEPAPRLWIEEPIFEDGRFVPGTVFKHEFVVRNEGGAPLEIKAVRTGCSCAVAGYDRVIPPGGTGR